MIRTAIWVAAPALFLCLVPLFFPYGIFMDTTILVLIMGLFAVSLNLMLGHTGMMSLGHAAFFGIGAYTVGILLQKTALPFVAVMGAVILFSAAAALIVGFFCIRLGTIYFAMLTLAFAQVVYGVIIRWASLTGGDQGLIGGIPRPAINLILFNWDISKPENFYILTVILVMASLFLCKVVMDSPFGAVLKAIRENPGRIYFTGLNVRRHQLITFVISGVFAGIAGALMALHISGAYPDFAFWTKSAEPIFMVLIGGIHTFIGPLLGAVILQLLMSILTTYTSLWGLVLGGILIVFTLVLKKGIADILAQTRLARRLFSARFKTSDS